MNLKHWRTYAAQLYSSLANLYDKVRHTNKKDSIIFLICLAISTAMWLLLSLSEVYTARITVPVKFINVPEDRIIVSNLISEIEMEVEAAGFSLVSYRIFSGFNALQINLSEFAHNTASKLEIPDNYIKDQLTTKLSSQDRLVKIRPENIGVLFSAKQYKKVPVLVNDSLSFRKQYFLASKVQVSPDSVQLFGPAIYLSKINHIVTNELVLTDMHETTRKQASLLLPDSVNDVSISTKKVDVTWQVDQFTEGTTKVGIQALGLAKQQAVRFFPDSVSLTYQVGLNQFEKITPSMFTVEADFSDSLVWKNMAKIRLKPNTSSDKVTSMRIQPASVEFLFSSKN